MLMTMQITAARDAAIIEQREAAAREGIEINEADLQVEAPEPVLGQAHGNALLARLELPQGMLGRVMAAGAARPRVDFDQAGMARIMALAQPQANMGLNEQMAAIIAQVQVEARAQAAPDRILQRPEVVDRPVQMPIPMLGIGIPEQLPPNERLALNMMMDDNDRPVAPPDRYEDQRRIMAAAQQAQQQYLMAQQQAQAAQRQAHLQVLLAQPAQQQLLLGQQYARQAMEQAQQALRAEPPQPPPQVRARARARGRAAPAPAPVLRARDLDPEAIRRQPLQQVREGQRAVRFAARNPQVEHEEIMNIEEDDDVVEQEINPLRLRLQNDANRIGLYRPDIQRILANGRARLDGPAQRGYWEANDAREAEAMADAAAAQRQAVLDLELILRPIVEINNPPNQPRRIPLLRDLAPVPVPVPVRVDNAPVRNDVQAHMRPRERAREQVRERQRQYDLAMDQANPIPRNELAAPPLAEVQRHVRQHIVRRPHAVVLEESEDDDDEDYEDDIHDDDDDNINDDDDDDDDEEYEPLPARRAVQAVRRTPNRPYRQGPT